MPRVCGNNASNTNIKEKGCGGCAPSTRASMEGHSGADIHTDSVQSPILEQVDVLFRNCGQWRDHVNGETTSEQVLAGAVACRGHTLAQMYPEGPHVLGEGHTGAL